MNRSYIHGYDQEENIRLQDQAFTLVELLHFDTSYPAGSRVLEVGCGVGAQTVPLAKNSPTALITSLDISESSLAEAQRNIRAANVTNVEFLRGDIFHSPFRFESFDHIFVCFVLEHLPHPLQALEILKNTIRPGGTITVIEGDHGSACFYPDSYAAHKAIQSLVELQRLAGGNAMIGRELYPLLRRAGYRSIRVSPRMVYVDPSKPELVEGFIKRTFTPMVEGIRDAAIKVGIIEQATFDKGVKDLYRTTEPDGVFCYTFFKVLAEKTDSRMERNN